MTPPEVLCDEDGRPVAFLGVLRPFQAWRRAVEEFEDICDWIIFDDNDREHLDRVAIRSAVHDAGPAWFRFGGPDEPSDEFGDETWYPCSEDWPGAVRYTSTGLAE